MSEGYEIIIVKPYGQYKYGDIAEVAIGLYCTLIDKKIGIPIDHLGEIEEKQKLVGTIQELHKDNKQDQKLFTKLYGRLDDLEEDIDYLKEILDKNNLSYTIKEDREDLNY